MLNSFTSDDYRSAPNPARRDPADSQPKDNLGFTNGGVCRQRRRAAERSLPACTMLALATQPNMPQYRKPLALGVDPRSSQPCSFKDSRLNHYTIIRREGRLGFVL